MSSTTMSSVCKLFESAIRGWKRSSAQASTASAVCTSSFSAQLSTSCCSKAIRAIDSFSCHNKVTFSGARSVGGFLHAFNQDAGHFLARELRRRQNPVAQHRSHFGAAQFDVRFDRVRASLVAGHAAAMLAEEDAVEEQRPNPEVRHRELPEDFLRFKGAVILADPGVVASDDEMGASVVLPHQGMEDGLARPRVARPGGIQSEERAFRNEVVGD